jgi:transposase
MDNERTIARDAESSVDETEGGRRPPGVSSTGGAAQALAPGQRWSVARKREVVLRILRGESIDALSRELGVEIYRLERWREDALSGIDNGLKKRKNKPIKGELSEAIRRIGELTMENELLWKRVRTPGPLAKRRSKK